MAVSSSKAVTSSLVQEEIRRDLAREVELKQEARRRLQEDTSVGEDSLDGDETERREERGRSKGRVRIGQRSQSSHRSRTRVYFGGHVEESPKPAPSYTIYKEGGQGFTKYTVFAKQQQEQERKVGATNKTLQSAKRAAPTKRPMEVQGKQE